MAGADERACSRITQVALRKMRNASRGGESMRWYASILRDHPPAAWQIIGTAWFGKEPVGRKNGKSRRVKFDSLNRKGRIMRGSGVPGYDDPDRT